MARRALRVGLIGLAVTLIALMFGDARLRAKGETQGDGRIAFAFGESSVDRPSQLGVMDADGKHVRVLPPWHVAALSLSPDGRFIAYVQRARFVTESPWPDLRTINVDGRPRSRRVVRHAGLSGGVAWSPDGRSIAFGHPGGGIWVVNLSDHRQRQIVRNGHSPTWSPNEKKLAFVRGKSIWVVDISTKKAHRLIRNGAANVRLYGPRWSPDGHRIAFERIYPGPGGEDWDVYVARADGSAQRRLGNGGPVAWSPDGREIAFGHGVRVIRERLDGSDRRELAMPLGYYEHELDWARGPRSR